MKLFPQNKPKIRPQATKPEGFSGWIKCTSCSEMVHGSELEKNLHCCPKCQHHYRISASQRIQLIADPGTFEEKFADLKPADPLAFVDLERYPKRIEDAKRKSGRDEAVLVGTCKIGGRKVSIGIMDFSYMGGSMGSVVGERLTRIIELATAEKIPVVIFSSSGGARMQESTLSLMQMAKTAAALARHSDSGHLYISVLTDPTTGGVTASFATLGDVIIAEPDALIGFTGPRVIEQTIRQKLPPGAQRSAFLQEKGMIDLIVGRQQLKDQLSLLIRYLAPLERRSFA